MNYAYWSWEKKKVWWWLWRNFCALQCGRKRRRRRMRKTVLGEKQQFFCGKKKHAEEVWAETGEESVCSTASLCMCVCAHTCQVVFVSTIRLKAVLNKGLIFKVLQMSVKPRMDVFVPVGILFSWYLYNITNSFPEFAQGKSPGGGALPVSPVCPVRLGNKLFSKLPVNRKKVRHRTSRPRSSWPRIVVFAATLTNESWGPMLHKTLSTASNSSFPAVPSGDQVDSATLQDMAKGVCQA